MRMIDADALHKRIKAKNTSNAMMRVMKAECLAEIDDAPTIEPERKIGEWKHISDGYVDIYECDQCRKREDYERNYCPDCGAYMKKENKIIKKY